MSNLKHEGCMCAPGLTWNAAQRKIVNLLKTLFLQKKKKNLVIIACK